MVFFVTTMEWQARRFFLGVQARAVKRDPRAQPGGSSAALSSLPLEAGSGTGESYFLGFTDADLGQEGVALVRLNHEDDQEQNEEDELASPTQLQDYQDPNQTNQKKKNNNFLLAKDPNQTQGIHWVESWSLGKNNGVSCLDVSSKGMVWAGTCAGDVCSARAGETSENNADQRHQGGGAFCLNREHSGVVASVCCNPETTEALSAGCDGRVLVHEPERGASNEIKVGGRPSARQKTHDYGNGEGHLTCACWLSGATFVTGTGGGGALLRCYDYRSGNLASSSALRSPHAGGLGFLCCSPVPTRPHLCLAGHEGLVSLWDLRRPEEPCLTSAVDGMVWGVVGESPGQEGVSALLCTSSGVVARWACRAGGAVEELHRERGGVRALDLTGAGGAACVTQEEGLVVCEKQEVYAAVNMMI